MYAYMGLETRTDASQAPIPRLCPFLSLSPFPILACCHIVVVVVVMLVIILLLPFRLFVVMILYYIVNKQKKEGKKEKKTYLGLMTLMRSYTGERGMSSLSALQCARGLMCGLVTELSQACFSFNS